MYTIEKQAEDNGEIPLLDGSVFVDERMDDWVSELGRSELVRVNNRQLVDERKHARLQMKMEYLCGVVSW